MRQLRMTIRDKVLSSKDTWLLFSSTWTRDLNSIRLQLNLVYESPNEPSVAAESVGSQPPTSTAILPRSIGKKRPRSSVWDHFNVKADKNDDGSEVKKPDGSVKYSAVCKICETPLSTGGRGGTSHLRRHAESCVIRTSTEKGQTIIGRTENGVVYSFKFNKIIARRETVRYFVVEELPFVKVEKPTFHRWIKMAFGP
ncbi:hypothetical protein IFM89_026822 [Coptis chinensis]|uniref:BED-type domain-containing protein n=1 Tax=Coptis chinensis TaxID=261450 RepID=A0A835H686_9MAGN|nr:hypothetical protein IFM89_026822 [Coptis chinensis]